MKPNVDQLADAVDSLGTLPMFPAAPGAQREVMRALYRMVSTEEQLEWLITTVLDHSDQWRGAVELRGIFCTRFTPADGVEAIAKSTTGYTPADIESEHIEALDQSQKRIAESPVMKVFSARREERIREMEDFVQLLDARKKTAPFRLGVDAARAIKQIERMSTMVRAELESLGTATADEYSGEF